MCLGRCVLVPVVDVAFWLPETVAALEVEIRLVVAVAVLGNVRFGFLSSNVDGKSTSASV